MHSSFSSWRTSIHLQFLCSFEWIPQKFPDHHQLTETFATSSLAILIRHPLTHAFATIWRPVRGRSKVLVPIMTGKLPYALPPVLHNRFCIPRDNQRSQSSQLPSEYTHSTMAVYNHWTGLVDWTGGLTLKIIFTGPVLACGVMLKLCSLLFAEQISRPTILVK